MVNSDSELSAKRIAAVDSLWRSVVGMRDYYSDALSLVGLYTAQELNDVLGGKHPTLMGIFEANYRKTPLRGELAPHMTDPDIPATRPFVSDRLWSLFYIIRAVHGRLNFLVGTSYEKRQYVDWTTDDLINNLVSQVLAPEVITQGKNRLGGFSDVICRNLETAFLEEARRVLDGDLTGGQIQDLPEVRMQITGFRDGGEAAP